MQWVKVPLVVAAVLVLVFLFRHRGRVGLRAGARVLAFVLFAVAVVSIIVPDLPQWAAETVGVARGTDLLLYVLVVVYVLTTLGLYFRVRESDQRLRRLARDVALERAERDAPWAPVVPPARAAEDPTEPQRPSVGDGGGTAPGPAVGRSAPVPAEDRSHAG